MSLGARGLVGSLLAVVGLIRLLQGDDDASQLVLAVLVIVAGGLLIWSGWRRGSRGGGWGGV